MGIFGRVANATGQALSGDYGNAFRVQCHQLVRTGYDRISGEDHSLSVEDDISMRLVEEINSFLRSDECPRWGERYCVRDQAPQSASGVAARRRPRVDIEMESTERGRPSYHFEAKRLRNNNSIGAYLGEDGLGCFLSGRYGASCGEGGMLGYVQCESPDYWAGVLSKALEDGTGFQLTDDAQWLPETIPDGPTLIRNTYHIRVNLPVIRILHSFLDFRSQQARKPS